MTFASHRQRFLSTLDGWSWLTLTICGLLIIPVAVVVSSIFIPLTDIWAHLFETVLQDYILNTLQLTLGVLLGTFFIGVGTAWLVTMCRFPGRRLFEWALFLPMAIPAYVLAYNYTGLLDFAGPVQTLLRDFFGWSRSDYWFPEIRSLGGAITMLTLVLYPYVYMLSRSAFLEQSVCVLDVSRSLGCTPHQAFVRVALPLARPSIMGGLALVLMETLGDFGTVDYFAVDTFTTGIFRIWFGYGEVTAAAQLSAVLMMFIFILLWVERASRRKARFFHTTNRYQALPNYQLKGIYSIGAMLACLIPATLGFLLPVTIMLSWSVTSGMNELFSAEFITLGRSSMMTALVAAILTTFIALIFVYARRFSQSPISRLSVRIGTLGYAVPGIVVAVGLIIPMGWLDNRLDHWAMDNLGVSTGLIFSGTLAILIFAYLVRFLAVACNGLEASLDKITPSMDAASRSLGLNSLQTLRRVHLPIMWGSILNATLLVFVDVMKELPATLVLRPFNFNTLAVRAYELASDERLTETGLPALIIVLLGLIPVIILNHSMTRSRPGHRAMAKSQALKRVKI
ncbi:MAG: iron ABC transporter permease [Kordiimonas sp.]|nr:iron ABC transporter permease [Kordiimonas sp.]